MQIVINVNNELYEYFSKRRSMHDDGYFTHVGKLIKALRDGTILPKGHGRLIDISDIEPMKYTVDGGDYFDNYEVIDWEDIEKAPTIIEADK